MFGVQWKALERRIGLRRDATRAPVRGPEWQGADSMQRPPLTTNQTPPDISLLRAKNGLDNGVHFTFHFNAVHLRELRSGTGLLACHSDMPNALDHRQPSTLSTNPATTGFSDRKSTRLNFSHRC